jgi:hypothetical protein
VVDALSRQEHNILAISSATPAWIHDIEESYLQDTTFTTIIEQLLVNDQAIPDYSVHAGILRYKEKICIGASTDLRTKILSSLYSSALGALWNQCYIQQSKNNFPLASVKEISGNICCRMPCLPESKN